MAKGQELAADQASLGVDTPLEDWPLRPWILAGLLAFAGLLIQIFFDGNTPEPPQAACAALLFFGSLCAAFTIGPKRLIEPAIFALIGGLVMAGVAYNVVAMDNARAGQEFAFAAGVFATLLALPLFQAGFHKTRFATDYTLTHFHVWTDAVSAAGALLFTGLSWLLLLLLNGLLELVGIGLIEALWDEGWFGWTWSGGAFGAALGVLRNNLKVIGALQSVVMIVLSLLAVPLAMALVLFLGALLLSGGQSLWDATDDATPILLMCAVGCFILANAIFRDDDAAGSGNRLLKITAMVLSAGILPLAVFAAISMGLRIDQYGLAPERIWALVAIIVASAYGVAYWAGLLRGRFVNWAHYLRRANLHLAALTCVLALILALPIFDFGAMSARNQIARLEAHKVTLAELDLSAFRWDFGDAGREALAQFAESDDPEMRLKVASVQGETSRRDRFYREEIRGEQFTGELIVDPAYSLPEGLRRMIYDPMRALCTGVSTCRVYLRDNAQLAIVIDDRCDAPDVAEAEKLSPGAACSVSVEILQQREGGWRSPDRTSGDGAISAEDARESLRREREAIDSGDIRIEPSPQRQLYIGDKPVGRPFN